MLLRSDCSSFLLLHKLRQWHNLQCDCNVMICTANTNCYCCELLLFWYSRLHRHREHRAHIYIRGLLHMDCWCRSPEGWAWTGPDITKISSPATASPFSKEAKMCYSSYDLARHSGTEHEKYSCSLWEKSWKLSAWLSVDQSVLGAWSIFARISVGLLTRLLFVLFSLKKPFEHKNDHQARSNKMGKCSTDVFGKSSTSWVKNSYAVIIVSVCVTDG